MIDKIVELIKNYRAREINAIHYSFVDKNAEKVNSEISVNITSLLSR